MISGKRENIMDWEAIGAIGELIGAIAVLVSLVYLALQVKANTASSTIASRQSVSREFRDWVKTFLTTNPEHFAIGMTSYQDMPYRERADFCHQLHDLILFYQSAQAMHEAGVVHADLNLRNLLVSPGGDGAPDTVSVIDLDRSPLASTPPGDRARRANLDRMMRSLRKFPEAQRLLGDSAREAAEGVRKLLEGCQKSGQQAQQGIEWLLENLPP